MDRQAGRQCVAIGLTACGRKASLQLATRVPAGLGWLSMVCDAPLLAGRQISQCALGWPAKVTADSVSGASVNEHE